jgi:hypothetical protein
MIFGKHEVGCFNVPVDIPFVMHFLDGNEHLYEDHNGHA